MAHRAYPDWITCQCIHPRRRWVRTGLTGAGLRSIRTHAVTCRGAWKKAQGLLPGWQPHRGNVRFCRFCHPRTRRPRGFPSSLLGFHSSQLNLPVLRVLNCNCTQVRTAVRNLGAKGYKVKERLRVTLTRCPLSRPKKEGYNGSFDEIPHTRWPKHLRDLDASPVHARRFCN
jgi:hypothetical protein